MRSAAKLPEKTLFNIGEESEDSADHKEEIFQREVAKLLYVICEWENGHPVGHTSSFPLYSP